MPIRVAIYGAGGHGSVVADVVRSTGAEVLGCVDDHAVAGQERHGLPILGDFDWALSHRNEVTFALGVGDNEARQGLAEILWSVGLEIGTFVHSRAWVSPSAHLGIGTVVMPMAVVNAGARVGAGVIINTGAIVEHDCRVGAFSHMCPNVALGGTVTIGSGTQLGIGAAVRPNAHIGNRVIVGAGAVVLDRVEDGLMVAGVPAKRVLVRRPKNGSYEGKVWIVDGDRNEQPR